VFQSTRPHGARHNFLFDLFSLRVVSIHAPARGATYLNGKKIANFEGFNPRARTGRDIIFKLCRPNSWCFNPRARTGRDNFVFVGNCAKIGFNPRARTGRDNFVFVGNCAKIGFNPRARTGRDRVS